MTIADDMIKTTSDQSQTTNSMHSSYRCVADFRNTGKSAKIMIRYLNKNLHVYVDTNDAIGYKFCFAVQINLELKDHHIVYTAATGQVADTMDIHEITTRYLPSTEQDIDDSQFSQLGSSASGPWSHTIYWLFISLYNLALISIAAYILNTLRTLLQQRIDAVYIAQQLNPYVIPHYIAHGILTIILLFSTSYLGFVLNAPLLAYRIYEVYTKQYRITSAMVVAKQSQNKLIGLSTALTLTIAYYAILQIYYLYRWVV